MAEREPTSSGLDVAALEREARAVLASDLVTPATRRAMGARLDAQGGSPRALTPAQMRTLRAAAARLVPLAGLEAALDLAGRHDAGLADGPGDGWRYAALPPDREAQAHGLDALEAAALATQGRAFAELDGQAQDALLSAAQAGDLPGPAWPFPSQRWFEELLAALTRIAYGHPLTQVALGYRGFADAHGQPPAA